MSDDPEILAKERKMVKRTKSFWKFGKNTSDNEILEGMALWKHRDLVDVEEMSVKSKKTSETQITRERISRDKSNDSERTINNNPTENYTLERPKQKKRVKDDEVKTPKDVRRSKSFNDSQKLSLIPRKSSEEDNFEDTDNIYGTAKKNHYDDQFYEDDGDGLMLKTVNRKNILKQYNSTGTDSETESDVTSDDPYDCILVEDQKVQKNENRVAELGKKLEKLSKNSKFSPNKEKMSPRGMVQEKNTKNVRLERHVSERKPSPTERDDMIKYHDQRKINNFKTFTLEVENVEVEEQGVDEDLYYSQNHVKRNNEMNAQEKRRYFADSNNKNNTTERRGRPSYESINSEVEHRSRDKRAAANNRTSDKRDKMKYYDSTNDEVSDTPDSRQLLPRTKLAKTNSNNSSQSKYQQEIGLMEYGETLQRRLKNPEYNSKYDEKSPHNGNMYGPWYDLWGLDSTGPVQRK